jgi:hypothetical protein
MRNGRNELAEVETRRMVEACHLSSFGNDYRFADLEADNNGFISRFTLGNEGS